ncbi:MAG: dihydroorotase family protein [Candidatus Bathyarchaeia archaeon]
MKCDLILSNAKAYINNEIVNCSIALENGKIVKIGREAQMPKAEMKMDLKGLLVLPGLIDVHVHLRDEGKAYKEDFYSGTASAAAGGMTTVLDMPNNEPVTMSAENLKNRIEKAENRILVNVGFYSEFPRRLEEIKEIVDAGAIAFKLFMIEQVGGLNINDDSSLAEAFKILSRMDVLIAVHAEDGAAVKAEEQKLKLNNRNDIEAFLEAHSERAEQSAIKRLLNIVRQTPNRIHICHVSTKAGLETVQEGKKSMLPITCEVTPHHLLLSHEYLKSAGIIALTVPPVREKSHVEALWMGIKGGIIDVIASDHAPHVLAEKVADVVWDVKTGVVGLETTLPLLLTEVNRGNLALSDVIRLMAENPAKIFGLGGRGFLSAGNSADLTVVDLKREGRIDASKFHSKAKFSPFDGWRFKGKPVKTFVNGKLVMDDGEIVCNAGSGRILRRKQH